MVFPKGRSTVVSMVYELDAPDEGYLILAEYPEDADPEDKALKRKKLEGLRDMASELLLDMDLADVE